MSGGLYIVGFFIAGIVCGFMGWIPLDSNGGNVSFYALCALMFCVGISVGNNPETVRRFRTLNPRLALLPLATMLGTWAGCIVVGCVLRYTIPECLAVGSGFGYYSLSSILITETKGETLGLLALLSNLIRELVTLLGAPLLVRFFGSLAPISAGGATTADTTLPVITRCCGEQYAMLSIYHGFVVDFSVPFLVTLFTAL